MSAKIPAKNLDHKTAELYQPKTVDLYEDRKKIYVKKVKGLFQQVRTVSLWLLMAMYFSICWISIDGQQLVHFNLPERQFHIFGATFWPQDFVLLSWLLIICAFGLFFITTLFGRVWCGYTCPQTAWTFIFMWLEEYFEGSRNQRIKLDDSEMDRDKIKKKALKHASWVAVAFATGLTFVGYFYPIRELVPDLITFSLESGWAAFWIVFFTIATYLNAGWMREQVCLYMCPYARFQSVMFDPDTLVVSYNPQRGEARGSRKKTSDYKKLGLGDCVDCGLCVQVCPTGIDIRDGLQYECIGCAKCIDACDSVMDKMAYPRGLISYTTEQQLENKTSKLLRPRTIGYAVVFLIMVVAFSIKLGIRDAVELEVLRDRGSLYQTSARGYIENAYTLKVVNMSKEPRTFQLSVSGLKDMRIIGNTEFVVPAADIGSIPVGVEVNPSNIQQSNTDIIFTLRPQDNPDETFAVESRFLGPVEER